MFDRMYRRLLRLYPRAFRERFTPEMLELLAMRRARAARSGWLHRWLFPMAALGDLTWSAWRELGVVAATVDDLRSALRRLRRSPALMVSVVSLLALAIGSATVVFSVVNAMLLRPLPYSDPDRLAILWEMRDERRNTVGGHEFPQWQRRNKTFDAMSAIIYNDGVHLTGQGEPISLLSVRVSASFFNVMGIAPAVGRAFTNEEDTPGNGAVVILSDRLWRSRFGADVRVVGTDVMLNGRPSRIIGVMPPGFGFPPASENAVPDLWSPIAEPIELYQGRHFLIVVGRLKADVTLTQAQADLTTIAASLEQELPQFNLGHRVSVTSLQAHLVREARTSLLLLLGAVGCLLLIGCGNVAGLLLARGIARRREVALELALGATQVRIARQLLLESTLMSVAGGLLGLVIAIGVIRLVPALVPPDVARLDGIEIDRVVLMFALGISVLTGLLFGIAPALQFRRFGFTDAMRRGGRSVYGIDHPRLRRALVSAQVALTVLLVLGAGLTMRGLIAIQHIDPGFSTDRTLAMDLSLRGSRYRQPEAQRQFFETLTTRLQSVPGVVSVGATNLLPLSGNASGVMIAVEGRPAPPPGREPGAQYRVVSTGYFDTIRVPLVSGRTFTADDARLALPLIRWWSGQPLPPMFDRPQAAPVTVVNESMAKAYWPGESALGRRFQALESPMLTIIGVVADMRTITLRGEIGPEFYLSDLQEPQTDMGVVIRTTAPPADVVPAARAMLQQIDPNLPITSIRTMDDLRGTAFNQPRFLSILLGIFGLMALLLMTAGIYGLLAFTTMQRMPEMGIRIALGAVRSQIHGLILREGLTMTAVGLAAGLLAAVGLSRLITEKFLGVPPTDALTYLIVTMLVIVVVTIACWLPARRAAHVDPIVVLKQE
jgi:putative ABC transport system permease protein